MFDAIVANKNTKENKVHLHKCESLVLVDSHKLLSSHIHVKALVVNACIQT